MNNITEQITGFISEHALKEDIKHLVKLFHDISLTGVSDFTKILIENPSLSRDVSYFSAKYRRLLRTKERELKELKNQKLFELRQAYDEGRIKNVTGISLPQSMIEGYVEGLREVNLLEQQVINLEALSKMLTRLDYQSDGRTNILIQLSVNRRSTMKEEY
jgi:hypothetical protein